MKPDIRVRHRHSIASTDSASQRTFLCAGCASAYFARNANAAQEKPRVGISVSGNFEKKACKGLSASSTPAAVPRRALAVSWVASRWKNSSDASERNVSA